MFVIVGPPQLFHILFHRRGENIEGGLDERLKRRMRERSDKLRHHGVFLDIMDLFLYAEIQQKANVV